MVRAETGFTLVELIAVIILIGLLAVAATPLFSTQNAPLQASRDDLVAALFYAQQVAMARDDGDAGGTNPITFEVASPAITVKENGTPLALSGVVYPLTLAHGVTVSMTPASVLHYDKLGRTTASVVTLTSGSASVTVNVSASGYAN